MRNQPAERTMLIGICLVVPLTIYLFLRLFPEFDPLWQVGVFHFYIVSYTSLVALVVACFIFLDVGRGGARPTFITMAFASMAGIFFIHGISTPGILLEGPNPAVGWSARLSLSIGTTILGLGLLELSPQREAQVVRNRVWIWLLLGLLLAVYIGIVFGYSGLFEDATLVDVSSPLLALFTIVVLGWSSLRVWRLYQRQSNRLYFALTLALPWLALAQVSQYEAPLWGFSWWMYHVLMLSAFTVTMMALLADYEQARDFRLTRYFVFLSVILAVPLVFLMSEAAVQLSEVRSIRWSLVGFSSAALVLLFIVLVGVVDRAQRILDDRAEVLEQEKQWRADLTSLIAHDLKNPLNSIFLDLYLVENDKTGSLNDVQREKLNRVQKNGKVMLDLIQNMLDVERLEAGALPLELAACNLSKVLYESVNSVVERATMQRITVTLNIPDDLPPLRADQPLLQRVLQNLLTNALKFTPPEGKIHLEATSEKGYITVSVSDTGPGVPPHLRDFIFQKFGQVRDGGNKREGYGLGLALCKLAVERHGGAIYVEDAPGGGSRFIFSLPADTSTYTAKTLISSNAQQPIT